MTKLYYDDPLIAAYMCKEFDVKFTNRARQKLYIASGLAFRKIKDGTQYFKEEYFVSKGSLDIFKPQVGDMIEFRGEYGAHVYADNLMKIPAANTEHCDPCFAFHNDVCSRNIFQRNGKRFFMPKVVQDDE